MLAPIALMMDEGGYTITPANQRQISDRASQALYLSQPCVVPHESTREVAQRTRRIRVGSSLLHVLGEWRPIRCGGGAKKVRDGGTLTSNLSTYAQAHTHIICLRHRCHSHYTGTARTCVCVCVRPSKKEKGHEHVRGKRQLVRTVRQFENARRNRGPRLRKLQKKTQNESEEKRQGNGRRNGRGVGGGRRK